MLRLKVKLIQKTVYFMFTDVLSELVELCSVADLVVLK